MASVGHSHVPCFLIRAMASSAAELLDMTGKLGVIAPGALSDLVAVGGDPLANVEELGRVIFVLKDGKTFRNDVARPAGRVGDR